MRFWRAGLSFALVLAACAPSLDWREAQPPDAAWVAMFPCRPVEQIRELRWGDKTLPWRLRVCSAADVTFAIGDADVLDPAQVGPALRALRQSAQALLPAAQVQALDGAVKGMTPQPDAGRWLLSGKTAQGTGLQVELILVSRGTRVVQAMLIGPQVPPAAAQTFFEGLRLAP